MLTTFIACLGTETNTFSPMPTGLATFEDTMLYRGDATQRPPMLFSEPLIEWRQLTEQHQGQVHESIAAFAQPAGITVRSVYEGLRDELLRDLERAMPVDMVLLNMHGAMVADGYDDCEGDLLARVRERVGPDTVIGVELDLHCSITQAMLSNATVMVTYKEYPHVDVRARAREVFDLCFRAHNAETRPVMRVHDCRMINMWRTPVAPTRALVDAMQAAEGKGGVLSVSFAHGFPWGDVPDASAKVLVVADANPQVAEQTARQFGERIWALREETSGHTVSLAEAMAVVARAAASAPAGKPVVVADVADNAGGGAPSDSTFALRAIVAAAVPEVASGYYWDPLAIRFCQEAGVGASLALRIGGKCGIASGQPIDLQVTVKAIVDAASQRFGTARAPMGTAVWVQAAHALDLVLVSQRGQVLHPDGFEQLGIDLRAKRAVFVKSTQHFYAGFAPLAGEVVYMSGEGAIPADFAHIPYAKFKGPYWPRDPDPFR